MARSRMRDVVVVLPGITGSVLRKDGHDLWAISGQAAWRALRTLGRGLDDLRLEGDDPEADRLGDGIVATRVMPDAHLVPGLVKIDGYSALLRLVTDHFEVIRGDPASDQPANLFEFPYDWRRDNRAAARALGRLVERALPRWREFSGAGDARVILLAHSMGGLVSRYWLEVLGGWRHCRALVTFGTPHRGSVSALSYLANGYKALFVDLTEVMRHLHLPAAALHQVVQVGGAWQRVAETDGIPGVDPGRALAALAFHREIEDAVTRNRDDPGYLREGYRLLPVVGTRQRTFQSGVLNGGTLRASAALPAGLYRVKVATVQRGPGAPPPVHDLFEVAG